MQFTVLINQTRALEWGLNSQQAMLFAFLFQVPSWATPITKDGKVFHHISKTKVIEEVPLLTDKPDTVYRLMRALQDTGLIELATDGTRTLMRITDAGQAWADDRADLNVNRQLLKENPDLARAVEFERLAHTIFDWVLKQYREEFEYLAKLEDGRGGYIFNRFKEEFFKPEKPIGQGKRKDKIPSNLKKEVFERDGYRCQRCGDWHDLCADHIIPESRGGETTKENLQALCRQCNTSKGNKMEEAV